MRSPLSGLRTAFCGVFLMLWMLAPAAAQKAKPSMDDVRSSFLELINAERQRQGLEPLALDPALVAAAQAHADDMTARRYYDFASPDGQQIEQWAEAAGYRYQFITEKIANESSRPQTMVERWARLAEANRPGLFNPAVEDLGVGIGTYQTMPVYTFVVARSEASYLADYTARLFNDQTARFRDLDSLRRELIQRINEARAARGLAPLAGHPALDLAAQDYADDLFHALREGRPRAEVSLVKRVKLHKYALAGALGQAVGQAVVQGALTPEETLAALVGGRSDGRSEIFGKGYREIGIGLAFERKGDGFDVVWVQCLARPAITPPGR
jgi:uncharacterized protein YkwD